MCKLLQTYSGKQNGFTLMELLVVIGIATFVITAVFGLLGNAQSSFFNTDTSIDVRSSLRLAGERMGMELRNTGYKGGVAQFTILDNTGTNGSDTIRFAIPILCSTTNTLLDTTGNPANWGAPLTWGCNQSSCMDLNDSCTTLEYRYIQYSINASNQLERKVLDGALTTATGGVSISGQNIKDLQISVAGNALTFTLTGEKMSAVRRTITVSYVNKVTLNNWDG